MQIWLFENKEVRYEAQIIGFDEYIYSGNLCLMEWPELIEQLLPEETVRVDIMENPDGTRVIRF